MILIDGSFGEGGGQILRTALGLSLYTGKGFIIENIRAQRRKPGLLRQHLTAVRAATEISNAHVIGAEIGSGRLEFEPATVKHGSYRFAVGTAGSATLVFQTVLPGLLTGTGTSELVLEGGTHNPMAPPFEFLAQAFCPVLARMGAQIEVKLEAYGFYPAGGGRFRVKVQAVETLAPLSLMERGEILESGAVSISAKLPFRIAHEESSIVAYRMGWDPKTCIGMQVDSCGPGNVVILKMKSSWVTEIITAFGEKRVPVVDVVESAVSQANFYLKNGAPVGVYLADQLLVPMAIAGTGRFVTTQPSLHTRTNIEVIKQFLPVDIRSQQVSDSCYEISIK